MLFVEVVNMATDTEGCKCFNDGWRGLGIEGSAAELGGMSEELTEVVRVETARRNNTKNFKTESHTTAELAEQSVVKDDGRAAALELS